MNWNVPVRLKSHMMVLSTKRIIGSCANWYTSRFLRFGGRRRKFPRNAFRVTRSRLTIKENSWAFWIEGNTFERTWDRKIIAISYWNELMCLAWSFLINPTIQYVHDYLLAKLFSSHFSIVHCFLFCSTHSVSDQSVFVYFFWHNLSQRQSIECRSATSTAFVSKLNSHNNFKQLDHWHIKMNCFQYTCGRAKENQIVFVSLAISRRHCIFFHSKNELYITDLKV